MQVRIITVCLFCLSNILIYAQDDLYLKVHFLYGSTPLKKYKNIEKTWFGGRLGGHVGIEKDSNSILNFTKGEKFHWFSKKNHLKSAYKIHEVDSFYAFFGGNPDSSKRLMIYIPVTPHQAHKFDSISAAYLSQTPYDYALFGMRCGSATYEILSQLGIVKKKSYRTTYWNIFYPKKLRKKLIKKGFEKGWKMVRREGSHRRKWEQD